MPGRQSNALETGAVVCVAIGLDLLGEPPVTWHPVVWFGKLIKCLEHAAPQGRVARFACIGPTMEKI